MIEVRLVEKQIIENTKHFFRELSLSLKIKKEIDKLSKS